MKFSVNEMIITEAAFVLVKAGDILSVNIVDLRSKDASGEHNNLVFEVGSAFECAGHKLSFDVEKAFSSVRTMVTPAGAKVEFGVDGQVLHTLMLDSDFNFSDASLHAFGLGCGPQETKISVDGEVFLSEHSQAMLHTGSSSHFEGVHDSVKIVTGDMFNTSPNLKVTFDDGTVFTLNQWLSGNYCNITKEYAEFVSGNMMTRVNKPTDLTVSYTYPPQNPGDMINTMMPMDQPFPPLSGMVVVPMADLN